MTSRQEMVGLGWAGERTAVPVPTRLLKSQDEPAESAC